YEAAPFHEDKFELITEEGMGLGLGGSVVVAARVYLAPFNDSQIDRLIRNWYTARESSQELRDTSIRDLRNAIFAHPGMHKLARIPNLLTMMALIHRVRARLPQGRVNLYTEIADAYLQTIDEFRGIRESAYTLTQRKHWLAAVAYKMQVARAKEDSTESFV